MEKRMDGGNTHGQMGEVTKEDIKMGSGMDREHTHGQMGVVTLEIGKIIYNMGPWENGRISQKRNENLFREGNKCLNVD